MLAFVIADLVVTASQSRMCCGPSGLSKHSGETSLAVLRGAESAKAAIEWEFRDRGLSGIQSVLLCVSIQGELVLALSEIGDCLPLP